ncbi:adenylate/guanylate cyclase domain-containing protein [Gilvimarinus sp. SDUM040013]|uniref:Adenylate/guanylate cyclase domain-containing protein n=1 Tax=Gilvimarinus gilvus TaxID=3058038 RepID=A0ABU4RYR9_9GAMM|nr:adenylate/guanylate cyclase domain-containing protein [Gilvimarinus sp. SDUM040013]MDO3386295.1 adenylate/guanylate cyclase domain-containing protein [Gilvimarinus sp. SDUM040013]MDX6850047.1 adenylate/guanylate cyclase domain-containing protein [Gilvimarinus sp. SDUM040013]
MTAKRTTQTVMFADVSGSSRLYKEQGNTQAKNQIDSTLDATRAVIETHQGVVIKTLGDEIMARFTTPETACQAAIELQRKAHISSNLSLRIGIAFGDTLMDSSGDVFGQVVNDAADVSHIARGSQVVITEALKQQLPDFLAHQCEAFDRVRLKGAEQTSTVFRLHWETTTQPHNATAVMDVLSYADVKTGLAIELSHAEDSKTFNIAELPITFGRDESRVKWHADNTKVSREHCELLYRRGKFVLIDHSTNGTYISTPENDPVYIRREETPLTGSGIITLGQRPDRPGGYQINFAIEN